MNDHEKWKRDMKRLNRIQWVVIACIPVAPIALLIYTIVKFS